LDLNFAIEYIQIPVIDISIIKRAIDYCVAALYPQMPLKPLPIPEVNIKIKTIPIVINPLKI
jgi:hypothetical protein